MYAHVYTHVYTYTLIHISDILGSQETKYDCLEEVCASYENWKELPTNITTNNKTYNTYYYYYY